MCVCVCVCVCVRDDDGQVEARVHVCVCSWLRKRKHSACVFIEIYILPPATCHPSRVLCCRVVVVVTAQQMDGDSPASPAPSGDVDAAASDEDFAVLSPASAARFEAEIERCLDIMTKEAQGVAR